jgi:hypothetical protein
MSHSHRHHHLGYHAGIHRDKVRRRWKIVLMLAVGLAVVAVLICLNYAR